MTNVGSGSGLGFKVGSGLGFVSGLGFGLGFRGLGFGLGLSIGSAIKFGYNDGDYRYDCLEVL